MEGFIRVIQENYCKLNSLVLNQASHKEIWAMLTNGRQDALLALYDKYYLALMNYGLRLTGDRDFTNDCISQILLRIWDKRENLPKVENPRSYLLTCLRHELFAERKAQHFRLVSAINFSQTVNASEPSYEEYLIQLQSNKTLREKLVLTLQNLTAREKELLRMKFFENMDYTEIAIQCGITKRTAYNIIHAALKTLKAGMINSQNISMAYDIAMITMILMLIS